MFISIKTANENRFENRYKYQRKHPWDIFFSVSWCFLFNLTTFSKHLLCLSPLNAYFCKFLSWKWIVYWWQRLQLFFNLSNCCSFIQKCLKAKKICKVSDNKTWLDSRRLWLSWHLYVFIQKKLLYCEMLLLVIILYTVDSL